jgi:hypothetical protein
MRPAEVLREPVLGMPHDRIRVGLTAHQARVRKLALAVPFRADPGFAGEERRDRMAHFLLPKIVDNPWDAKIMHEIDAWLTARFGK